MATWNSRGLRGSTLEELVNRSNERYRELGLALIQKIPTPITPIKMDKAHHQITLAYFDQRSTVDYIGAVQGFPVCFDAKESVVETFPLHNIHPHQMEFMKAFEQQGGIRRKIFSIICPTTRWQFSGNGRRMAAAKASAWMNWMRRSFSPISRGSWCLTWI